MWMLFIDISMLQVLLDHHSPMLPRAEDGQTPLDFASKYNRTQCVKLLGKFDATLYLFYYSLHITFTLVLQHLIIIKLTLEQHIMGHVEYLYLIA